MPDPGTQETVVNVLEYEKQNGLPTSLKNVAWVFIAFGIASAVCMLLVIVMGGYDVDPNVLGIFCGKGLLRRSRGWRTYALVTIWVAMIGSVMVGNGVLWAGGSLPLIMHGRVVLTLPLRTLAVPATAIFGVAFWGYRTLISAEVVSLFRDRHGLK